MQKQAYLKIGSESLQIPYPPDFKGAKSLDIEDTEIHINSIPRLLTEDEIPLVENYIKTLPYPQSLLFTGAVFLDPSDPLVAMSNAELDKLEADELIPSTKYSKDGGLRQPYERVLILRESGYQGVGRKQLTGV
jgi:hypothetical protein